MQRPLLCAGLVSNRMARKYHHPPRYSINAADDEYIDIEVVNSFSPESRSFEFQMSSVFADEDHTIFPADDLFYKGKLLPLFLPPRLQTFQGDHSFVEEDDFIIMDFASSPSPFSNTSTPLKSCRLSFELSHGDYFESSTGLSTFISGNKHSGKFWSNKLRLIKRFLISKKLKASRAFLRSLFRKSACIDVASAKAAGYNSSGTDKQVPNGKCFHLKYSMKVEHKKTPFVSMGRWRHPIIAGVIKKINKERIEDKVMMSNHRRSLSFSSSAEFRLRRSPVKCLDPSSSVASSSSFSSSSISFSSSEFYELNFHNRSCSFASDFEGSIEAAITHCKQSQELPNPRKTLMEAGLFALSANQGSKHAGCNWIK